ncbi:MAG: HDIG domain-containing protein [Candidatus Bathyarchaeota archaeon]|nr:MAG: HDIG domain-containing protein [Candidatus Bathyarchaeota archaeon]
MSSELSKIAAKIQDKSLREKVTQLIEKPTIRIGEREYTGLPLAVSPAGLSHHHSYSGGLLEHMEASTEIALGLCKIVERIYGGKVDRDLVIAGMLLHDIFKPLTYERMEDGTYATAPLADRLDHLTLAVSKMIRMGFPLDLVHIVGAHHGGSAGPIWPRTIEALICHLADITDSRLNGEVLRAARYLSRTATGEELNINSSKEAFDIVRSKQSEHSNSEKANLAVKDAIERIIAERKKG